VTTSIKEAGKTTIPEKPGLVSGSTFGANRWSSASYSG